MERVSDTVTPLVELAGALYDRSPGRGWHAATGTALFELGRTIIAQAGQDSAEQVRLVFAQRLVLALEFLIAADILATLHAPSLEGVGLLGVIIAIRTILVHSIAYEVRHAERR